MEPISTRPQRRRKAPDNTVLWIVAACAVVALGVLVAALPSIAPPSKPAARKAAPSKVTYENFRKVRDGMTHKQVLDILGDRCTVPAEIHLDSIKTNAVILQWEQGELRFCQIGFMNGIVYSRIQVGLK